MVSKLRMRAIQFSINRSRTRRGGRIDNVPIGEQRVPEHDDAKQSSSERDPLTRPHDRRAAPRAERRTDVSDEKPERGVVRGAVRLRESQRFIFDSTCKVLPILGSEFFSNARSSFDSSSKASGNILAG